LPPYNFTSPAWAHALTVTEGIKHMLQWLKDLLGWNSDAPSDQPENQDSQHRKTIATELRRLRDDLKVAKVNLTTARTTAAVDYKALQYMIAEQAHIEGDADKVLITRLLEEAGMRREIEQLEERLAQLRTRADEIQDKLGLGERHKVLLDQAKRASASDDSYSMSLTLFDARVSITRLSLSNIQALYPSDWRDDPVLRALGDELDKELEDDGSNS
jgi:hypothetical protein